MDTSSDSIPILTAGSPGPGGCVAYWRVSDIGAAVKAFADCGATIAVPVQDVGEGIKVATVSDPFGNAIGLLENPHFALPPR